MKRSKLLAVLVISVMVLAGLAACSTDLNVVKINIKTPATKTMYEIGEDFTATGLVVEKTMSKDSKVIVCKEKEYTVDSSTFDNTKVGEYAIVIKLTADPTKTVEYKVTVLAPNVVASIAIKSGSAYKSVFEIGEEFSSEGLIVEKVMSRGNRVVCLATEFSVDSTAFDNMTSGEYTIIVTLTADNTKTVSYKIFVPYAFVGKYQSEDYKSAQITLSLDILPDGTAISHNASTGSPSLYTYTVTPLNDDGGLFLEFTFARYYYEDLGASTPSEEYFSGVYTDGIFDVTSARFAMYGKHSKIKSDFKLLEVVFLGTPAACYYFTDEFMLDSSLFGLTELIKAGSIGIYTNAECTTLVDASAPITTNTTLYIAKIANQSIDKAYYGTYAMPITAEPTGEITMGLPYFVGDAITHGDFAMNYIVTKTDNAYTLSIISFNSRIGDSLSIRFDEESSLYVMEMGDYDSPKLDVNNYAVISIPDASLYLEFSQFVVKKGTSLNPEFLESLGFSFSYIKDDVASIYVDTPITEDTTLYVYKALNIDFKGKQFSAGELSTIYFYYGNTYNLRVAGEQARGTYTSVLSDNECTITFLETDTGATYTGIYNIELKTLVVTLNSQAITYEFPKYAEHAFLKGTISREFNLPSDVISFDVFGYVRSYRDASNIGTYTIANICINGKYAMTVTLVGSTKTGYYDAVTNRVVLDDTTYYDSKGLLRFHPLTLEGLTSVECYDQEGKSFLFELDGRIRVQIGEKSYYVLCIDITLVEKGVYELIFQSSESTPITKIVANIFGKTYTVTVGEQDYVFTVPPIMSFSDEAGNEVSTQSSSISYSLNIGTSLHTGATSLSKQKDEGQETETWTFWISDSEITATFNVADKSLSFSVNGNDFVLIQNP